MIRALRAMAAGIGARLRQDPVPRGHSPWSDLRFFVESEPTLIFDVGANTGALSLQMASLFPAARVLAFEPVQDTFAALVAATAPCPRISCFNLGFSERPGLREVFKQADSGWTSIEKDVDRGLGTHPLRMSTIDEFVHENGLGRIGLIKTDTEGHDVRVLRGGERSLRAGAVDAVFSEVGFYERDSGHTYFPQLHEYMTSLDFQFVGMYGSNGLRFIDHPTEPGYPFTNVLYLRNALVQARYGSEYAAWIARIPPG